MTEFAIETEALRKEFDQKVAVAGLTMQVPRGEVFGFLGPNGAGKTTSIKMLLALTVPTSGAARVLGLLPGNPAARRKIGFLPEHFRFHDWLNATEFLALHASLYGMPARQARQRAADLLDRVGLTPHASKKLRTYSKGMLQRVGLAQALLNHPELVFLDEPTSGLDPVGRRMVRDVIRELAADGTTVFLNSHLLSEIEITCQRVAFIKHGEVVHTSPLQTLVAGELSVTLRAAGLTPDLLRGLERWGKNLRQDGLQVTLTVNGEADLPEINRFLVQGGADVYSLTPQRIALEDLFIQIVGSDGGL